MPQETRPPAFQDLITGHFQETRGYHTWRERGTTDWLLILTLGGQGRFGHAGDGDTLVNSGDAVLLRPGTRHDYGVAPGGDGWELLWSHFQPRPHWGEWLRWPEQAPGLMLLSLREPIIRRRVIARFGETHRLATGPLPRRDLFAMNALEEVLLWCGTQNPRAQPAHLDERVQAALDFLHDHLGEKVTLEAVASHSALSPSRLSHLFRRQMGLTPQQYLEQQRLARARQLLERTSHTVGAIAAQVGFENPFYFTLRFKRQTGFSPSDWRRRSADREAGE